MNKKRITESSELVLVTGANGFIGPKVIETLFRHGFTNIRALVRSSRNSAGLQSIASFAGRSLGIVQGNLLSRDDCRLVARDVSLIFHLAAGTGKSFAGCFMNSALATRNLLDAALEMTHLKRFVNVSSLAVYSGSKMRPGDLLDENSPIESEHMARFDPYAYGKIKQ
ncbi:MAG: NAD-dependent epimerase/dehydratase family protein, partial [candidate division WOR-3 bacterium]